MTRLRSSASARCATPDKSSVGAAGSFPGSSPVRCALTTAAMVLGSGSSAVACQMCFGAEESSLIDGARLGVMVMLAITLAVQGAFLAFFLYLRRRAKRMAEVELDSEWSELQRASSTS